MPRKRTRIKEIDDEDEDIDVINVEAQENESSSPVAKKHKKHKKKHGSSRKHDSSGSRHFMPVHSPPAPTHVQITKPPIKLKIRIGSETFSNNRSELNSRLMKNEENSDDYEDEDEALDVVADAHVTTPEDDEGGLGAASYEEVEHEEEVVDDEDGQAGSSRRSDDDETSEEEKQWLDALEAGNLEDYEKKKQEKDPSLLTARQRSLLSGATDVELLELPSGYKTTEMTEEQQQRRKQRALKRRIQAHEKKEKAKKQTLDRLLKKQEESSKRKKKGVKAVIKPYIRYINSMNGISISMPAGIDSPFVELKPRLPPKAVDTCGAVGCTNPKKYTCSRTGVPLCSFECYKKNLAVNSSLPAAPS